MSLNDEAQRMAERDQARAHRAAYREWQDREATESVEAMDQLWAGIWQGMTAERVEPHYTDGPDPRAFAVESDYLHPGYAK